MVVLDGAVVDDGDRGDVVLVGRRDAVVGVDRLVDDVGAVVLGGVDGGRVTRVVVVARVVVLVGSVLEMRVDPAGPAGSGRSTK